jgi:hypothetical protein
VEFEEERRQAGDPVHSIANRKRVAPRQGRLIDPGIAGRGSVRPDDVMRHSDGFEADQYVLPGEVVAFGIGDDGENILKRVEPDL